MKKGEEQRRAGDSRGSRGEQDKRKKHRPAAAAAMPAEQKGPISLALVVIWVSLKTKNFKDSMVSVLR